VIEGLKFIELSPGYFRMGSHHLCERGNILGLLGSLIGTEWGTAPEHARTECPRRWVEIPEPFWIATKEVTNEQFESYTDDHERCEYSSEDDQPAGRVSLWGAMRFCQNAYDWSKTEQVLRLPTEEEWEYACRAGTTTEYFFGDAPKALEVYAHYEADDTWESDEKPIVVGSMKPNPWGLFDMTGNVWEWCSSEGPKGDSRVIRGGGCRSGSGDCRSATRRWTVPGRRIAFLGFRPVLVLQKQP